MHASALAFLKASARSLPAPTLVVDLGGLNINGSPRSLFPTSRYIAVDLVMGVGVDVVADAAQYTPAEPPDLVLCCEVLEHAPEADKIVTNALRILPAGGTLLITCASPLRAPHSAVDGGRLRPGEFYRGVSDMLLLRWLTTSGVRLSAVQVERNDAAGDLYATARKAAVQA